MTPPVRYRFESFVLSPRQRVLLRGGRPVALIPKYFDLLLLLVRHRQEAVSKQTIFADIWSDVVVSDGALSQAVRTLRRALGDNSREPRFIRTVSRHGYQFVWSDVAEEPDDGQLVAVAVAETGRRRCSRPERTSHSPRSAPVEIPALAETVDSLDRLVDRLFTGIAAGPDREDEARETAERLHAARHSGGRRARPATAESRSCPGHHARCALEHCRRREPFRWMPPHRSRSSAFASPTHGARSRGAGPAPPSPARWAA